MISGINERHAPLQNDQLIGGINEPSTKQPANTSNLTNQNYSVAPN